MKSVEYKVVRLKWKFSFNDELKLKNLENQLNNFGVDGWEVAYINLFLNIVILKRYI